MLAVVPVSRSWYIKVELAELVLQLLQLSL